jgi:ABC-2 type transport system permease protein
MNSLLVIARRELTDLRRTRFYLILFGFLAVVMILSVIVASLDFRVKIGDYNLYLDTLRRSGSTETPPAPQLFPLQLLRGSIEYLELIGALFAIIIGYGTVAKEKQHGTLHLIFTRPVSRFAVAGGKTLAFAVAWAAVTVGVFAAMIAALVVIGNAPLQLIDLERLALTGIIAWLYLMLWSCVAMGFAALARRASTGLVVALVAWLIVVLIIPQIGDTMDPDNQVPGGLFKSLAVAKPDEKAVMANFAGFDNIRNGLEVSSITKHFERPAFAFLGIKDQYNQQPVGDVWASMLPYTVTLTLAFLASVAFTGIATTKRALLRRES